MAAMATGVQVVFDCADPDRLARFWAEALHYKIQDPPPGFDSWEAFLKAQDIPETDWNSASAVVDPDGVGPRIDRLVRLGARKSRTVEERGEYFVNMFDPEDNEFDVQ
jgi:hypothetical protein